MKQVVIIGPTACGKSALAVEIAQHCNGVILSVDSLSIYKGFSIVAAKPTMKEQGGITHFGIDVLEPNEHFSVGKFFSLYEEAYRYALKNSQPLIIVGGTSFYIKMLLEGLPSTPIIDDNVQERVDIMMENVEEAFHFLQNIDPEYTSKIELYDRYRISRGLCWYFQTSLLPSMIGKKKTTPLQGDVKLYEIKIEREILKERIDLRTRMMLQEGLIDEIAGLEKKYGRNIQPMSSIGAKEVLGYLDGFFDQNELYTLIATHTRQLAKRQQTFNKTQLHNKILSSKDEIFQEGIAYLL